MVRDPRGGHNRKQINEDFFKVWSPSMAYVLGFMFADGALLDTNQSSRTYYLNFSNNDLNLLASIKACLGSCHNIYSHPPHAMTHRNGMYISRRGYVLRIGNKVMYNDLLHLGMLHRKSNVMHLPPTPDIYFPFFLRGYFDGDGCINLYRYKQRKTPSLHVIFTSGSEPFLTELAMRLSRLIDIPQPKYYHSYGAFNLVTRGLSALLILRYMYTNLDVAPFMTRKYLKYIEYRDVYMGPRIRKKLAID